MYTCTRQINPPFESYALFYYDMRKTSCWTMGSLWLAWGDSVSKIYLQLYSEC